MDFLRILEGLRNPVLDAFFSVVTLFGDETFFILLAVTVIWCFRKQDGYYILFVGFLGTVCCQFLKLWFRIPRPWVLDPGFTIVESARAAAGGYSFPSGHTQNIVGTMTCVFLLTDRKCVRAAAVLLAFLVPFSRMYLGCHTPMDVGASYAIALLLAIGLRPLAKRSGGSPRILWGMLAVAVLAAASYLCFTVFYPFPPDVDADNLAEGTRNAYTLAGCLAGLIAAKTADERYVHYRTEAAWTAQVLKVFAGLGMLLVLKAALKAPLRAILPVYSADMVRYGLMVFFAGAVWPLTFPWFSKTGRFD